jgi:hypothetical protein
MSTSPSPEQIRSLAQRAQIFGLQDKQSLNSDLRDILANANREVRLLTAEEITHACHYSGVTSSPLIQLQNQASNLVEGAREALLAQQPSLVLAGGALYPQERADACWRDCFHFLRISFYAVAAGESTFTDPSGLKAMEELYALLNVPVPALLIALSHLRDFACTAYSHAGANHDVGLLESALNHLIKKISAFQFDYEQKS